jgi:methylenetetrahydrofolate dehydrogenase (NADP+)/methenyltetrahydrofolate cyclohydrolase
MEETHNKNIPGKELATAKEQWLTEQVKAMANKPNLKIIQVGEYAPSTLYTRLKVEAAQRVGIAVELLKIPQATAAELGELINKLNSDPTVHGLMLQAPLPYAQDEQQKLFNLISPEKDVDGLTTASLGKVWHLKSLQSLRLDAGFISATPLAVLDCLYWACVQANEVFTGSEQQLAALRGFLAGKKVLIVNRSTIVGKPLAALILSLDATVTIAHSQTKNLAAELNAADVILTAAGVPGLFKLSDLAAEKLIIDISISKTPEGKVAGDVIDYNSELAHTIAPVPGGVGPLTVINLLYNTYLSATRS